MFCAYCGTKVPDEARFCMACGKQIIIPEKVATPVSNSFDSIPYDEKAQAEFLADFFDEENLDDLNSVNTGTSENVYEDDDEEEPIVEEDLSEVDEDYFKEDLEEIEVSFVQPRGCAVITDNAVNVPLQTNEVSNSNNGSSVNVARYIKGTIPEIVAFDSLAYNSRAENLKSQMPNRDACFRINTNIQNAILSGVNERINSSINYMQTSTNGYYCLGCGNFIDYRYIRSQGLEQCQQCGTHVVGAKAPALANGWGIRLVNNLMNGTIDPNVEIRNYYNSDYFKSTGYSFQQVVLDKGLVGEYMLDIEMQKLRKKRPYKPFSVFYNVLIPEPNGSFQEVDALIVYGNLFILIEAKNRSGRYQYQHLTDPEWTLINESGRTQMHNPLLQNEEHITALLHYYNVTARETNPYLYTILSRKNMYNIVYLGPGGDFNNTILADDYDKIVIDERCDISCGYNFHLTLIPLMEEYDALCADQNINEITQNNIAVLQNILYQSQEDKDLFKRNRLADQRYKGKFDYQYYYLHSTFRMRTQSGSKESFKGRLVRTNGVYAEYIEDDWYGWKIGYDFRYSDGKLEIPGSMFPNTAKLIDLKNLPLEIVKAYRCVVNKEMYVAPDNM